MDSTDYNAEQVAKEIAEMMSSLEIIKNNKDLPKHCVDPVIKYCQECPYGNVTYGEDVETYADIAGGCFETHCSLGYDQGRPEDEPTEEQLKEFGEWCNKTNFYKE